MSTVSANNNNKAKNNKAKNNKTGVDQKELYRLTKPFLGYNKMRFDAFYDLRKTNLSTISNGVNPNKSCQLDYLKRVYDATGGSATFTFFSNGTGFCFKEFLQHLYLDYAENQRSGMMDQEALKFIEENLGYTPSGESFDDFRSDLKAIFNSRRLTKNIDDAKTKSDSVGVYAVVDNKSYLIASISNLIGYYKEKYSLNNDEVEVLRERVVLEVRRNFWEHFWGFWSLNILLSFVTVAVMVGFVFEFIPFNLLVSPFVGPLLKFFLVTVGCIAINYWINYVRYPKDWSWKNLKTYGPALDYTNSDTFKQNIGLEKAKGENEVPPVEQVQQIQEQQGQGQNQDSAQENPVVARVRKTNLKLRYKLFMSICWSVFKLVGVFAVIFLAFNFIPGAFTFLSGIKTFASVDPVLFAKIVELGSYILSGLSALFGGGALVGWIFYSRLKKNV